MPYATKTDVLARLGADDLGVVADTEAQDRHNDNAITAGLLDGAGLIDAALSAKPYELPLATPCPQVLVRINVDLCVYYLARTWDRMTDLIQDRHKEARADLMAIASGDLGLGLDESPTTAGFGVEISSNDRIATRDTQKGLF